MRQLIRREVVGRKQQVHSFILNNARNKLSPDSATFLLPTSSSVSGSCTALAALLTYMYLQLSNMSPVLLYAPILPSIARICTFQGTCPGGAIPYFWERVFPFLHSWFPWEVPVSGNTHTHTHTCLECKHFTKRRTLTVAELIYYTCVGSGRCG